MTRAEAERNILLRHELRTLVESADPEALIALAERAREIRRIKSAQDHQETLLRLATTRMAWTDARQAAQALEDLDAKLAEVRKR